MTLQEFQALSETEQANALWEGSLLSSRVVDDIYIQRYVVGEIFVEVYYDPMANKILKFVAV